MGSQQLLLIVVGVIIVGIAVAVGIQMFQDSAVQANKDAIVLDALVIASRAQKWYITPLSMGGGGREDAYFCRLTLDKIGSSSTTENGTISLSNKTVTSFRITIVGKEDGDGDGTPVTLTMTVYADSTATPTITD